MAFGTEEAFEAKKAQLIAELRDWYDEETEPIDLDEGGPEEAGTVLETCPAIDSKRVLDARCVTQKVLGMGLPGKIIRRGGYQSFEELEAQLVPKLKALFIGEIAYPKEKPKKSAPSPAKREQLVEAGE